VDAVDDAVAAVAMAGSLDRFQIRRHAVERFDKTRMIDEYLDAYEVMVSGRP
jgi:hypothetical protein